MPTVTRIVEQQHRAMTSVLFAMRALTRQALRSGKPPDFRWLRTLASYVERFPARLHHPNEEIRLFRVLLRREPGAARLVARLRREHAASSGYAIRLSEALAYWERGDPKAGPLSAHVANDFARFMWRHARLEQREVLPRARATFTPEEWSEVGRAITATADPLLASTSRRHCEAALRRLGGLQAAWFNGGRTGHERA